MRISSSLNFYRLHYRSVRHILTENEESSILEKLEEGLVQVDTLSTQKSLPSANVAEENLLPDQTDTSKPMLYCSKSPCSFLHFILFSLFYILRYLFLVFSAYIHQYHSFCHHCTLRLINIYFYDVFSVSSHFYLLF
jgi:hypothetical protein